MPLPNLHDSAPEHPHASPGRHGPVWAGRGRLTRGTLHRGGAAMPIARLIYVSVAPDQMTEAERVWKQDCAPLMIQAPGCLSEELLKCIDTAGEGFDIAHRVDYDRPPGGERGLKRRRQVLRSLDADAHAAHALSYLGEV